MHSEMSLSVIHPERNEPDTTSAWGRFFRKLAITGVVSLLLLLALLPTRAGEVLQPLVVPVSGLADLITSWIVALPGPTGGEGPFATASLGIFLNVTGALIWAFVWAVLMTLWTLTERLFKPRREQE